MPRFIAKAGGEGRTLLVLTGKGLKCLPSEIGNLISLEVLCLWKGELTTLPPEFESLLDQREVFCPY